MNALIQEQITLAPDFGGYTVAMIAGQMCFVEPGEDPEPITPDYFYAIDRDVYAHLKALADMSWSADEQKALDDLIEAIYQAERSVDPLRKALEDQLDIENKQNRSAEVWGAAI